MGEERTPLDRAIATVAAGLPVDWEAVRAELPDDRDRSRLDDLKALVELMIGREADLNETGAAGHAAGHDVMPARWGQLELIEEIGRGAYGVVYRAWDTRLARAVAVKLLTGHDQERDSLAEARRLARVSNPNVVAVYGADTFDGRPGIWMELLTGQTLDDILQAQGPYSVAEAALIGRQLCGALAAVHAAGLVHRDIKAQNVMREPGGRLVLMDLGASFDVSRAAVELEAVAGTPLYMAPELFEGARASRASDIYALGVLLYRLVTGQFPIEGRTIGDVRDAHRGSTLRPLREARADVSDAFVNLVECCLMPDPRHRFGHVAALDRALSRTVDPLAPGSALLDLVRRPAVAVVLLVALATAAGAIRVYVSRISRAATTPQAIAPDVYRLFAGYEELALSARESDPAAAARAVESGLSQIRSALPGNQPVFGLLYARLAEAWRGAGDFRRAETNALDATVNVVGTVGETHPFTAIVALELARVAQAAGDHRKAAAELLRALTIRARVLGVDVAAHRVMLDPAMLEQQSAVHSCRDDSDHDGLLDLIEAAAGLDPRTADSDHDGMLDEDEDHDGDGISNRLALGLISGPFFTWAHYGAHDPRTLGWQSPSRFPMIEAAAADPPAWSLSTSHTQGYFTQRLSPRHSARALSHGFSVFTRLAPVVGVSAITVDTAPVGPRFDLLIRRIDDRSIDVRLATSVVPTSGPHVSVPLPDNGRWPLLELRYRPPSTTVAAYLLGRPLDLTAEGHRQFQDPQEGGVAWGISALGEGGTAVACRVELLWLEVF